MRQFPQTITRIIEQSGLNLNNISQGSGLSNAYLAKLVRGRINRPGKDKIASIMLALNYTISEIDAVLADYDYQPLHAADIPEILHNNRHRKIVGANLPQYDHIYFDLLLVVLERIGGKKVIVKNRPSGVFMPHDFYLAKEYHYEANDSAARFRYQFTSEIVKERRQIFISNCQAGHGSETYICKECLDDYLQRHLNQVAQKENPERTLQVIRYFANALSLSLKQPEKHRIYLMERCPYFHFLMVDADGEHPKVSYPGRKLHVYDNEYDKRMLEGFTADLPHIVAHFRHEVEMCNGAVDAGMVEDFPRSLEKCIYERFERYGLLVALHTELATLMKSEELLFH